MKILTFNKKEGEPESISEKTKIIGKLITYLFETKDESLIKESEIERIEIYDSTFIKIYFKTLPMIVFDYNKIEWLRTHHYMFAAKYSKEECEKLYDLIKDKLDWFIVEDWFIKNRTYYGINLGYKKEVSDVTYDRDFIYVKGKNTGLKTTSETVQFVNDNKQNWF